MSEEVKAKITGEAAEATAQTTPEIAAELIPSSLLELAGKPTVIGDSATTKAADVNEAVDESAIATPGVPWDWDSGIKGDGEKPEWLKERYKSVAEQAKAYPELEKRLGEFKGAPKDGYNLDALEGINSEDPLIGHFKDTFKDLNLSQRGFDRIVTEFAELQQKQVEVAVSEEIRKMGPNAKQRVEETVSRIDNKYTPEVADTIKGWLITASDFDAFDGMQAMESRSSTPTFDQSFQTSDYESVKEVLSEKTANWKRYKEDESYRGGLSRRMHMAHAREKAMKKT